MLWQDYISSDPKVMLGKPVIKGTRITVELIIERLGSGQTIEDILISYPHITNAGILACLQYAASVLKNDLVYEMA
ncbi:MAG: DUF433 domain-containing protein [Saprospiraceae bacterium]